MQINPDRLRSAKIGSDRPRSIEIDPDQSDWPRSVQINPDQGPDRLTSTQINPDCTRSAQINSDQPKSVQMGPDRPRSTQIGQDRPRSAQIGSDQPRLVQIGPDRLRSIQIGPDQSRSAQIKSVHRVYLGLATICTRFVNDGKSNAPPSVRSPNCVSPSLRGHLVSASTHSVCRLGSVRCFC